jgi:aminopeptidase N
MTESEQSFSFDGLAAKPVPSILRDFSAPVILNRDIDNAERAFLMAHDTDPFNKWDAGRALARDVLMRMISEDAAPDGAYMNGVAAILRDDALDPAFRALCLSLPSEDSIAKALHDAGQTPDPSAIHLAREALSVAMAQHLQDILPRILADSTVPGPFSPDAKSAGKRSLGNAALGLISRLDGGKAAKAQYAAADNMTMQLAGLAALLHTGKGADELAAFRSQWREDRLVMDKWFGLQVALAAPEKAAEIAERLTQETDFDMKNPNRFRAVFGALAGNAAGFHDPSGASYRCLGDWLVKLDAINPQTTARMTTAFETWRRYDAKRQALIRGVLEDLANTKGLSRDTAEMVGRMLG